MIFAMFRRVARLFLLISLTVPAFSQSQNITIEPDLRLFTTMAALNAAGFDIEFGPQYHPVREAVRKYAEDIDPDLRERLKAFYREHKGTESNEAQLAKYISLAVMITQPPDFKPVVREELMPPDARTVLGFTDLMREFYTQAHIAERWGDVGPEYGQTINQLGPELRNVIVRTDAYLMVPLGGATSKSLAVYVELAAPVNTVHVRSYQDNYYVVLGGSTHSQTDDVRHAYLHFMLDNLVGNYISKIEGGASLLSLLAKADGVDPTYTSTFRVLATESLIRAIELRMDKTPPERAKQILDTYYRTGLLLTPYFYDSLKQYEELKVGGIREYFPDMIKGIQFKTEQERFETAFYKIPVPQKTVVRPEVPTAAPVAAVDPVRDLLKQGETAFNAGDNEKAEEVFSRILADFDGNNGAALYGLGLIASKKADREEALRYFERTTRSPSAEPSMKVWSYVFMARILDLECDRERAIEYYQQATRVGDDTRNAQAAAREGLNNPYGDACK